MQAGKPAILAVGQFTGRANMQISLRVFLVFLLAAIFGVITWPERYDLVADGEIIVRKTMNQEPSLEDALYILKPGERLAVSGCVDSKSDVAARVIAPSGVIGYVGAGEFKLKKLVDQYLKCSMKMWYGAAEGSMKIEKSSDFGAGLRL